MKCSISFNKEIDISSVRQRQYSNKISTDYNHSIQNFEYNEYSNDKIKPETSFRRIILLVIAVTVHNIPGKLRFFI